MAWAREGRGSRKWEGVQGAGERRAMGLDDRAGRDEKDGRSLVQGGSFHNRGRFQTRIHSAPPPQPLPPHAFDLLVVLKRGELKLSITHQMTNWVASASTHSLLCLHSLRVCMYDVHLLMISQARHRVTQQRQS